MVNPDPYTRPEVYEWVCAARDVEMEVERYRAKSKGGSLMPLTYALRALESLDPGLARDDKEVKAAVKSAVTAVERELDDSLPKRSHIR